MPSEGIQVGFSCSSWITINPSSKEISTLKVMLVAAELTAVA
jgi:hypothetical protein